MSSLETHYRRWLRWYPADHRRRHEDEMLGVLLAAAGPGQERPGLAERADLLLGAVEIRLTRAFSALTGGWRDALAVLSVTAPVLLVGLQLRDLASLGFTDFISVSHTTGELFAFPVDVWATSLGFVLVAALTVAAALRGARVTAATLACASLGGSLWLSQAAWSELGAQPYDMLVPQLIPSVAVLALTLGPGPVRGLELIGLRRLLLLGVLSAAAFSLDAASMGSVLQLAAPIVFAVIGGLAMGRPATRRAAAVLSVPIYVNLWVFSFEYAVALTYLLPAVAFVLVAAWTIRRRHGAGSPAVAA